MLNGFIAFLTVLSFAEMSSAFPESGGTYTFAKKVLSVQAAFGVGWVVWFASIAAAVLYAVGFASYAVLGLEKICGMFLPVTPGWVAGPVMEKALAVGVVVLYTALLTRKSSGGGQWATAGKLVVFAVLIGGGLWALKGRSAGEVTGQLTPFLPRGPVGLLEAMGFTFIALQGFDIIAALGGEVRDPERTLPRAMLISLGLALLVYLPFLFVLATAGVEPDRSLLEMSANHPDTLVAVAVQNFLGAGGFWLVVAAALLSTLSALYANLLASSRVALAMARDRTLPSFMGTVHPGRGTPARAVLASAGAVITVLVVVPGVAVAGAAASLIFLLCFALVHAASFLARRRAGPGYTPFRVPGFPLVQLVGGLACMGLAVFQGIAEPGAGLIVSVWLLLGGVLFLSLFARRARVFDASAQARQPNLIRLRGLSPLVLVPVANPANAEAMVAVAYALAPSRVGRVLLLSVVKAPPSWDPETSPDRLAKTQEVLRQALISSFSGGMAPEALTTIAPQPWSEIARVSLSYHCESLLLGLNDLEDPSAGKHLEKLMSSVDCDVVVLRAPRDWTLSGVKNVLVPMAGKSGHDVLRARLLGSLVRTAPCDVTFFRVVPLTMSTEIFDRAKRELEIMARDEVPGPCRAEVLRSHTVPEEIVRLAEQADLVILGLQRHGRRKKMFGQVALRIAAETRCGIIMISGRG
jgi:amino acid transporter